MKTNWDVKSPDAGIVSQIQKDLEVSRILASSLVSRGIKTTKEAQKFLFPSLERDWHDPKLVPGLIEAVDAIEKEILKNSKILIFGDFDVDGITATALMIMALKALGAKVKPFIPMRQGEGYGLSAEAIKRFMSDDSFIPNAVITVDCGISASEEVSSLLELGIRAIITDHHEAKDNIPTGVPVCNPNLDPNCCSKDLAGVGVALKVIQELGARFKKPDLWLDFIDLAALGTIADRMSLLDENRALVKEGLQIINENPRPGILASIATSQRDNEQITSTSLSFSLIPRLNAAGRMGDALPALELLLCEDPIEAVKIAKHLEDINTERRAVEKQMSDDANEILCETYKGQRVILLSGENWHEGVKGIVASRIVNAYGVPVLLFTTDGDVAYGSGRSIGEVDLFEAVSSAQDLLVKFGGHKHAVGVTVKKENLDALREHLEACFEKLPASDFINVLDVDDYVGFEDLGLEEVQSLERMEPFGEGNLEPTFAISNVFISAAKAVGPLQNHLSFTITNGISNATAIYFRCENAPDYVNYSAAVDVVFTVTIEQWRGVRRVKLKVSDIDWKECEAKDLLEDIGENGNFANTPNLGTPNPDTPFSLPDNFVSSEKLTSQLFEDLKKSIAGKEIELHKTQVQALKSLYEGNNTLVVMATGRGKSMIFYLHAAIIALTQKRGSIFVYPLRALIEDQAFNVRQSFANVGLIAQVLTGETTQDERADIYNSWRSGKTDVILTTPEFLEFNIEKISNEREVGFIAIDESHHIGISTQSNRPVYKNLAFLKQGFPKAQILAVSATVDDDIAEEITDSLDIKNILCDTSMRSNLRIDDRRGVQGKEIYLASIVAGGDKTIVYVNSRQESIDITRMLRKRLPSLAPKIAFYNGILPRDKRLCIERMFREDEISVIIATSAFGEGVNVGDVRHIVLYHMPFSSISYNQMAGRCGRDGKEATIHLLYNMKDSQINWDILKRCYPSRDSLVTLYKLMKTLVREKDNPFSVHEIKDLNEKLSEKQRLDEESICEGINVFLDLGLLACVQNSSAAQNMPANQSMHVTQNIPAIQGDTARFEACNFTVIEDVGKVELASSVRYREGSEERNEFESFSKWAMNAPSDEMLSAVNHPIVPGGRK